MPGGLWWSICDPCNLAPPFAKLSHPERSFYTCHLIERSWKSSNHRKKTSWHTGTTASGNFRKLEKTKKQDVGKTKGEPVIFHAETQDDKFPNVRRKQMPKTLRFWFCSTKFGEINHILLTPCCWNNETHSCSNQHVIWKKAAKLCGETSDKHIPWRCNWNTQKRHAEKSTWKPLPSSGKPKRRTQFFAWVSMHKLSPTLSIAPVCAQEQPAEQNRQLQHKLCWCPLLRLQCPSWSETGMIGLICFPRPRSWLVGLRNFATRSSMRSWTPCLWGANSTMPKLTPGHSLSAFQCTPTTQASWNVPSVCETCNVLYYLHLQMPVSQKITKVQRKQRFFHFCNARQSA